MINVADLPAVRAQIERAAASKEPPAPVGPQYARAPATAGPQQAGGRPSATQRSPR